MSQSTPITPSRRHVPADADLLCEGCGYTLNGLADDSRCPECGKPIDESLGEKTRRPTPWEASKTLAGFLRTSAIALFRPGEFFRSVRTRGQARPALDFAVIHWSLASLFFGLSASVHVQLNSPIGGGMATGPRVIGVGLLLAAPSLGFIAAMTGFAARLSSWEGGYRGLRLPEGAVRRALCFHAPHHLPVALVAAVTTVGYAILDARGTFPPNSSIYYLYVLCAEVVLGAIYLFATYWTAMRNIMFANV